jgi:hypothetical protein
MVGYNNNTSIALNLFVIYGLEYGSLNLFVIYGLEYGSYNAVLTVEDCVHQWDIHGP